MTPEQKDVLARQIEVMQGALDGKEVEVWDRRTAKWYFKEPGDTFNWYDFNYRIKPEVKTFNVYEYTGERGSRWLCSYLADSESDKWVRKYQTAYKFLKSFDVEL